MSMLFYIKKDASKPHSTCMREAIIQHLKAISKENGFFNDIKIVGADEASSYEDSLYEPEIVVEHSDFQIDSSNPATTQITRNGVIRIRYPFNEAEIPREAIESIEEDVIRAIYPRTQEFSTRDYNTVNCEITQGSGMYFEEGRTVISSDIQFSYSYTIRK